MSCHRCESLCVAHPIRLPSDLRKALVVARSNLADGTIREVPRADPQTAQRPFSSVEINGPWDDVFSFHFECQSCGEHFTLTSENYHGKGGEWVSTSQGAK